MRKWYKQLMCAHRFVKIVVETTPPHLIYKCSKCDKVEAEEMIKLIEEDRFHSRHR